MTTDPSELAWEGFGTLETSAGFDEALMRQLAAESAKVAAGGTIAPGGWDAPWTDAGRYEAAPPLDGEVLPGLPEGDQRELAGRIASAMLGYRTLADVPDDPPGELLLGLLEPAGPTLLYAAPGTGKGMTGAWVACQALAAGMRPLVLDYEARPREWARRVSGLGGDRSRVVYAEPADLGPVLAGRPVWEATDAIRETIRAAGVDLVIIDSVLPATRQGEDRVRSDPSVPWSYVAAVEHFGVPSLSFGHTPKGQPEGDPFGSFGWLAAMRLTWLGTRAEADGHVIRWRPRKRNERGHLAGVRLSFVYADDGRPCEVIREDDDESTRDWLLAALSAGPRTIGELAEELVDEGDEPGAGDLERVRDRLSRALRRMAREGWVVKPGKDGRAALWARRTLEERP